MWNDHRVTLHHLQIVSIARPCADKNCLFIDCSTGLCLAVACARAICFWTQVMLLVIWTMQGALEVLTWTLLLFRISDVIPVVSKARLASSLLGAQELCQTLDITGTTAVAVSSQLNGSVFVACYTSGHSSIQQLMSVPLDQQAEALADLGDFLSALELASLLPESQVCSQEHLRAAQRNAVSASHQLFTCELAADGKHKQTEC